MDVQIINETHQAVLEKVGCTTLQQVYLSSKLYKEFTEKRHDKLVEKAHWRQAFQVLEIRITENAAAKYASIDTAPLILFGRKPGQSLASRKCTIC